MRTWPAIDVGRLSEPDLLQAALIDFEVAAIDERSPETWRVFFGSETERDRAAAELPRDFPDLLLEAVDVPDEDWAARSQANLRSVRVGRVIVAPPWDVPGPGSPSATASGRAPIVVVIQPSLGFGTGHHASTRLCLEALQQFDIRGGTLIDVGTGSGVLAIVASRLGAARVLAIDSDADAVESARDNAARNNAAIDIRVSDLRTFPVYRFDFVVANLTGALLMQAAGPLQDLLTRRGAMILSGFVAEEEAAVVAAFPRLRLVDRGQEDEWVAVTLQAPGAFE
jgi:ribosomal protein L11 methyltransferase